ncbi:MAG: replication-associated recombination protein A [Chloroflexota bacterium]
MAPAFQTPVDVASRIPLAARMRPARLEEFVGQEHILGPASSLRRSIESDRIPSMILWGPPGSGKTTLAEIIARSTHSRFSPMSAVSAGVADLRKVMDAAGKLRSFSGERTILFIDEIHRFNKTQQDAVLPSVENGTVTLIGATTENPGFQVNAALISRCRVFKLEQLTPEDILTILRRAIGDKECGLGKDAVTVDDDALSRLSRLAGGDARVALTALELAVNSAPRAGGGLALIDVATIEEVLQRPSLLFDRDGDMHYDLISAFIKSVRGSDPDAAVYWLARMLEAGEDPLFVVRRMVILAAEDIGLADPQALSVAIACQQAASFIGMPEGYLPLAECALYLATAPKSNSALTAYMRARADVQDHLNEPVPHHLRNAATGLERSLGYGAEYKYAHDYDGHYVEQQYLPDGLCDRKYYEPGSEGVEAL